MGTKAGKIKSEVVKDEKDFKILKKKSGRYAVLGKDQKWINGVEKAKILVEAGLVKTGFPKKEEAPAEEAPAAEASEAKADESKEAASE